MSVIKLDFDNPIEDWFRYDYSKFLRRMTVVESILKCDLSWFNVEESKGGNVHVFIATETVFSDLEVLAIQAILGSDYVREAFNFTRIKAGQKNWNILFDGKPYMSMNGHIKGVV